MTTNGAGDVWGPHIEHDLARTDEERMAQSVDEFYRGEAPPLPIGVRTPGSRARSSRDATP